MRKTLALSKETLRILDDEDLTRVVGGGVSDSDKDKKKNAPNSGKAKDKFSKCPGQK